MPRGCTSKGHLFRWKTHGRRCVCGAVEFEPDCEHGKHGPLKEAPSEGEGLEARCESCGETIRFFVGRAVPSVWAPPVVGKA